MTKINNLSWLYILGVILCLMPIITPPIALLFGIALSVIGIKANGFHNYTSLVLQASIVLLGFGMNLQDVIAASKDGFIETGLSVICVMTVGLLLGKLFKVEKNIAVLIASGTAICGGSAIAAVSPVLNSKDYQNSFALIVVFVLNAIALFLFPVIGHYLGLSQETFGNWAAIAIHDTSSVVGAGAVYGNKALQIATTVKLIRALWIIPLSLVLALIKRNGSEQKIKFPWFILLFVLAIIISNLLPSLKVGYNCLGWIGHRGMVVALFLIGSNITVSKIKSSGFKSFALGVTLWIITASVSLFLLNR